MDPIPEPIRQFIDENIESLEQLEILRVLGEDPGKEWTAAALAIAVQTSSPIAEQHLAALHSRGLLTTITREQDLLFRHGPRTPNLADTLSRLLQLYRERPVTMIKLVYARASDRLRAFADAFRVRKEG